MRQESTRNAKDVVTWILTSVFVESFTEWSLLELFPVTVLTSVLGATFTPPGLHIAFLTLHTPQWMASWDSVLLRWQEQIAAQAVPLSHSLIPVSLIWQSTLEESQGVRRSGSGYRNTWHTIWVSWGVHDNVWPQPRALLLTMSQIGLLKCN